MKIHTWMVAAVQRCCVARGMFVYSTLLPMCRNLSLSSFVLIYNSFFTFVFLVLRCRHKSNCIYYKTSGESLSSRMRCDSQCDHTTAPCLVLFFTSSQGTPAASVGCSPPALPSEMKKNGGQQCAIVQVERQSNHERTHYLLSDHLLSMI